MSLIPERIALPHSEVIILSGSAVELAPTIVEDRSGAVISLTRVEVTDDLNYAHCAERHVLRSVLHSRQRLIGAANNARISQVSPPDLRGSLSFTPASCERRGHVREGPITGVSIEFDTWFLNEACEQDIGSRMTGMVRGEDAKTFAISESIAASLPVSEPILCDTLLLALARRLGRVYGQAELRRDDGWLHPRALSRVIERIQNSPAQPAALADLAREAGLGVSAFIRAFRGATGITPASYAHKLRLGRAAELLDDKEATIGSIASGCGFASASHLIFAFRKQYGVTPSQWRRQNGRVRQSRL